MNNDDDSTRDSVWVLALLTLGVLLIIIDNAPRWAGW